MAYCQQMFAQVASFMEEAKRLEEEYYAEKSNLEASFRRRKNKLERMLEKVGRDEKVANEQVERKYKPKLDKLLRRLLPSQTTEFTASSNVGRGIRRQTVNGLLANHDGSDDEDGSDHENGSDREDGSEHEDGRSHEDGSGQDGSEDNGRESADSNDESGEDDNRSEDNHEPASPQLRASSRARRKRRLTTKASSRSEVPRKRRRKDANAASSGSAGVGSAAVARSDRDRRTVRFEDIRGKHRIVNWPAGSDTFYIFHCATHQTLFNSPNPIQGAAKHISKRKDHPMLGTHENAIGELGFLVEGCTRELAKTNNQTFDQTPSSARPTESQHETTTRASLLPTRAMPDHPRARHRPTPQHRGSDPETGIQPVSGAFYQICWSGTPFIALCLPTESSFETVGISGSIYETGLARNIPACYRRHTRTKQIMKGWNAEYEDGGRKASQRKFPFLFFADDVEVPSKGLFTIPKRKSLLAWVPLKTIKPFDFEDATCSRLRGYANALAFARLQPKSAATRTDPGPLSSTTGGDDNVPGAGQSQAAGIEAARLMASATLANGSEPRRQSAQAEQPATAAASRSEPEPAPSDRADDLANSAAAALDIMGQGPDSQSRKENADGAEEAPTSMLSPTVGSSEDKRPTTSEKDRPSFEDNIRSIRDVLATVGILPPGPVSDRQERDSTTDPRGRLDYIL